jgi:hypothetical protein
MGVLRRILSGAKALHVFLSFQSLLHAVHSMLTGGSSFLDEGQSQRNKIPAGNSLDAAVRYA